MKKFRFLAALLLLLVATFSFVGCGKEGDEPKKWEIAKQEWENTITSQVFTVTDQMYEGSTPDLQYFDGAYNEPRAVGGGDVLVKKNNGNEASYLKILINDNSEVAITEQEYNNSKLNAYKAVIDFTAANYGKFDKEGDDYTGYHVYSSDKVAADIAEAAVLGDFEIRVGKYYLTDGSGKQEIQIRLFYSDKAEVISFSAEGAVLRYKYNEAFDSMTSYTLAGGPSRTDVDYGEISFTSTGFYVYFPNRGTTASDKEFYVKDNGDGTYTRILPDNNGGWTSMPLTEATYNSVLEGTIKMYFGGMETKVDVFEWKNGKLVSKENYTMVSGRYTYTYSNVEITFADNGSIESITWNMQLHDSALNADSLVYNLTLTAGNTTITYPTVA